MKNGKQKKDKTTQITLDKSTKLLLEKVKDIFALQEKELGKELDYNTLIAILASGFLEGLEEDSNS